MARCTAFAGAIQRGGPLVARAQEGAASVELANAIIYSSAANRTIELPLDATAYEAFLRERIKTSRFVARPPAENAVPVDDMAASFSR